MRSSKNVFYEWDVEEVINTGTDEHPDNDVIEHNFQTSYAGVLKRLALGASDGMSLVVVLVCDELENRSWAYMNDDGSLPEYFEDASQNKGRKVPVSFHIEVSKGQVNKELIK